MNPKMPSMRAAFVVAVFLMASFAVSAVDLTVEYIDGFLDVRDGDTWVEVFVGDVVDEDAVIRLDADSIAELNAPGIKLMLTKPGIYAVSDLVEAFGEQRSVGLASMVGGKVASLFTEKKSTGQAAVMGVRGAKSESSVKWMTGDTAELINTGKSRLEENDLDAALVSFEEAYDFAEIDEETEVLFYLAYTSYLMGNLRGAVAYLGDIIDVDPDAKFFPNLYLLNGQVLAETFAFEDAVAWLEAHRNAPSLDDSVRQTGLFLEGVSYKAMKDLEHAKRALEDSRRIDPTSDVGKTASSLLSELE